MHLSDNGLHHNLVLWDAESLDVGLDLVADLGGGLTRGHVVVLLVLQVMGHDLLDAVSNLGGVESVRLFWLQSVGVLEGGSIEFSHL